METRRIVLTAIRVEGLGLYMRVQHEIAVIPYSQPIDSPEESDMRILGQHFCE